MVLKERIHECVSCDKKIHILFHEQAVCRAGIKIEKVYLISVGNMAM